MKKFFSYLLVMGAFLLMPLMVSAYEEKIDIPNGASDISVTTDSNGNEVRTYKIMISLKDNIENHKVEQKKVNLTLGKAIIDAKCEDFGEFVSDGAKPTKNSDGTSSLTCTFDKSGSTDTGNDFQIGTLVVTVEKDAADADCTIKFASGDSNGTINPDTGASLPVIVTVSGLLVAGAIYFTTKKRTKLYKI